jgi:hypothetical protein
MNDKFNYERDININSLMVKNSKIDNPNIGKW